jgi:hypothetical protein
LSICFISQQQQSLLASWGRLEIIGSVNYETNPAKATEIEYLFYFSKKENLQLQILLTQYIWKHPRIVFLQQFYDGSRFLGFYATHVHPST